MASVRLSDIINVTVFRDLPTVASPELTAFWQAGIVASNGLLNELANGPGKTAELPFLERHRPDRRAEPVERRSDQFGYPGQGQPG